MNGFHVLLPIIFPLFVGLFLFRMDLESNRKEREMIIMMVLCLNVAFAMYAMFTPTTELTLFTFGHGFVVSLHIDWLSKIFGSMVSLLWVVTAIYAFEYMTHETGIRRFFSVFIMTYGVVLGIAFSGNFLTMYIFYECLTLVTLPLVMHAMDDKARYAGKVYILYMMFGASLLLAGIIFFYNYSETMDFVYGGVLNLEMLQGNESLVPGVFLLTFLGFGVKSALFPLHRWLPKASIAPTPVTAILHAVAVVKSGIFAIIRVLYFSFGVDYIKGTWVQNLLLIMTSITIVYGSFVALRTPHIKRRFAYSTISNLSYILFGIVLMTPHGLQGALLHMVYHAFIKITLFFSAGAILYQTHKEYLYDIEGFGAKMPVVFAALTISGISLIGIPPFAGFYSKWTLATAAVESMNLYADIGVVALMISAVLTSLYIFYIIARAYYPRDQIYGEGYYDHVEDPNWYMKGTLLFLMICVIFLSCTPEFLLDYVATNLGMGY
ncbi:MAG: proton-conducting transporter membrane subunit [Bacillota bacterium]